MTRLLRERLRNQRLIGAARRSTPEDVVSRLGAVQAQDFAGGKWTVGLRSPALTDAVVQAAFDAGRLLRTHVLRPTWHFVTPGDIRWMLELTAPRVLMMSAYQFRRHELDSRLFVKAHAAFERALCDRNFLTRPELSSVLQKAGISATGQRLAQIVMRAELDGIVCSGPRRGNQFTYALLAERAAAAKTLTREEALAELAFRYFRSRGPATLADFAWWSSLTMKDARAGVEMNRGRLAGRIIDGWTYWASASQERSKLSAPLVHLLPTYDEYVISYKDRGNIMDRSGSARIAVRYEYAQWLVVDGRVKGTWKRTLDSTHVTIDLRAAAPVTQEERSGIRAAIRHYARFLERPVSLAARR